MMILSLTDSSISLLANPSSWKCASSANRIEYTLLSSHQSFPETPSRTFSFSLQICFEAVAMYPFCKGTRPDNYDARMCRPFAHSTYCFCSSDRFSMRRCSCFHNDLYICFCNNRTMSSNSSDFLLRNTPYSFERLV